MSALDRMRAALLSVYLNTSVDQVKAIDIFDKSSLFAHIHQYLTFIPIHALQRVHFTLPKNHTSK